MYPLFKQATAPAILVGFVISISLPGLALAQEAPQAMSAGASSFRQAFESAWARQPEFQSQALRREAAAANQRVASQWTADSPTLELSNKTDQTRQNLGRREQVAGISLPIWLPGERSRSISLADAEAQALENRASAAQLRLAAGVREAWWHWQRSQSELNLANQRFDNAKRLAVDVSKRVKAGDLSRADQHQADGAAATAEALLAEAQSNAFAATQRLSALTGKAVPSFAQAMAEPIPPATISDALLDQNPLLRELSNRADVARRTADLASVQGSKSPELVLATTRDRDRASDDWQQTVTVGIRIPFGTGNRRDAKSSLAHAEAMEAEEQLRRERERMQAELRIAQSRVTTSEVQRNAADKRASLARESRGFFEKSFRLGETDLPTRLRIELDAADAEHQALRARIDHAAAISTLRQAMGLLPE